MKTVFGKVFLLGMCALLLTIPSLILSQEITGENIILNPGFEAKAIKWASWIGRGDIEFSLDNNRYRGGKASYKLTSTSQTNRGAIYQYLNMEPGKTYELQGYCYLQNITPQASRLTLRLKFSDKEGNMISLISIPAKDRMDTWQHLQKIITVPNNTKTSQLIFSLEGVAGTIWLDDIQCTKIDGSSTLQKKDPLFKELLGKEKGDYVVGGSVHFSVPKALEKVTEEVDVDKECKAIANTGISFLWNSDGKYYDTYGLKGDRALPIAASWGGPGKFAPFLRKETQIVWTEQMRELAKHHAKKPDAVFAISGVDEPWNSTFKGLDEKDDEFLKVADKEIREKFGFGKYGLPLSENDTNPFRWIAFRRWVSSRLSEMHYEVATALRQTTSKIKSRSPNYFFLKGVPVWDFTLCNKDIDIISLDSYTKGLELERPGRGEFNTGFAVKLVRDLSGNKPVLAMPQTMEYGRYFPEPKEIVEWTSQAFRSGGAGVYFLLVDWNSYTYLPYSTKGKERWDAIASLSKTITTMHRVRLPDSADTAVLYSLDSYATFPYPRADEIYSAHAIIGQQCGSWFQFISDHQLEREEVDLSKYKVLYLPYAPYIRKPVIDCIEHFVKTGGVLVCCDPKAFQFDINGESLHMAKKELLGVFDEKPIEENTMIFTGKDDFKPSNIPLYLHPDPQDNSTAVIFSLSDKQSNIVATYKNRQPALISRQYGKGTIYYFGANPFTPEAIFDPHWIDIFKTIQIKSGAMVDRDIWRFLLPL